MPQPIEPWSTTERASAEVANIIAAMRHARARLAAAALVLVAAWEVAVLVSARRSEPSPEDWKAVAAAVAARSGNDALIVFAPRWIDAVGRLWLGDRISVDQAARMDAIRYREVWEVSIRGASAPEVAGEPAVSEQTFGAIRARRFIREAPTVTWDLTKESRIHEVDFEPRRGILLELHHPYDQARSVFLRVNLGDQLQVYAGLADYRTRSDNRSTAMIQTMVDGREVARGFVGNDSGWVALPIAATAPGPHDVEIVARVQEPRGRVDLSVCVAAEARTRRH
jgi:hypothetical protein